MDVAVTDARVREMFAEADRELQRPGRNLAFHPFVVGVNEGKLSRQQLLNWGTQTYIYVKAVIPYIAVAFGNCPNPNVRRHIWNNLLEEQTGQLTGTKAHPELLVDYALSVGGDRQALELAKPFYATRALMNLWEINLCHRHYAVGMAGMGFGGERQIPVTFRKVTEGLSKHYGLDAPARLFFDMHMTADEDHGDESIEVVAKSMPDDETIARVYDCIIGTAEAMWHCWMSFETPST